MFLLSGNWKDRIFSDFALSFLASRRCEALGFRDCHLEHFGVLFLIGVIVVGKLVYKSPVGELVISHKGRRMSVVCNNFFIIRFPQRTFRNLIDANETRSRRPAPGLESDTRTCRVPENRMAADINDVHTSHCSP